MKQDKKVDTQYDQDDLRPPGRKIEDRWSFAQFLHKQNLQNHEPNSAASKQWISTYTSYTSINLFERK